MTFGSIKRDPLGIEVNGSLVAGDQQTLPDIGILAPHVRPPTFGEGGIGRTIAGYLGDALLGATGHNPLFLPMMLKRQQDERDREQKAEDRAYEWSKPQVVNLGDGGLASVTPSGSITMLHDPTPKQTPLEQNIALYRHYNPTASDSQVADIVRRGIPGAAYDLGVQQPLIDARTAGQTAVANQRAANAASLKAQPTYAALHPRAGGGGGVKTSATRVVGGKAYYKIGGAWYDNPEGR